MTNEYQWEPQRRVAITLSIKQVGENLQFLFVFNIKPAIKELEPLAKV